MIVVDMTQAVYITRCILRKEVGIAIENKYSHLQPVRNSYVAIMHQLVAISSTM